MYSCTFHGRWYWRHALKFSFFEQLPKVALNKSVFAGDKNQHNRVKNILIQGVLLLNKKALIKTGESLNLHYKK